MTPDNSFVFHFGEFEVREREFCIYTAGSSVPVEPRAFRVLLLLLQNPQRVITKEELLNTVWDDVEVTDNSLTHSIVKLRQRLGDDARSPRFIETVSKVGYRFICPVESSKALPEAAPVPAHPAPSKVEVSEEVQGNLESVDTRNGSGRIEFAGASANGFIMAGKSFVFRFDDVEVREREFTLVKAGKELTVEPKAFRALLVLLRNPQKLISKEELLNCMWGDAAVGDGSLTRSIWLLCRVLNDDINEPRYIATVATVGYRFICPVEVLERAVATNPENSIHGFVDKSIPATRPERRIRTFRLRWVVVGAVLAVGLACMTWYLRLPLPTLRVSTYTQITRDGRSESAVGTDGIRLYLNAYPDSVPPAQVAISGGEISRIPMALPNPWLADVSPDGSTLLVMSDPAFSNLTSPGSIWSVRVQGGSLRRLTDGKIKDAAWSPDGKSVVFATSNGDIDVMGSDGTGVQRLANLPFHNDNFFSDRIAWSPDGHTIRFDRNNKIYEMNSDGSGLHPFLPGWHPSSALCCGQWTPNGEFFVFLSFDPYPYIQPASQLWALDEHRRPFQRTGEPVQLTSGPTRWGQPVPGKDGKKIFAMGAILNGELVHIDANSQRLQPFLRGISAEGVSFSPDGRFIAYVTFPEGILWIANRDGSNPMQLTDRPFYPVLPQWSPDGAQILFSSLDAEGNFKGYIISPRGGTPRPVLPEYKGTQTQPSWSPDGRKIVFMAGETAGNSLQVLDLASGRITTLPEGAWFPRWSPDGRFIAGLDPASLNLKVLDLETQRWSILQKRLLGNLSWSRDGKFIYFLRVENDPGVYRISASGGEAQRVVDLKGFQITGVWTSWMSLDPEDTPLLLRDAGSKDIYALSLEQK
jgi:DNA-binding winged helix-turn-helix (wHTH) protein/Tol biopolymer transport system component